MVFCILLTVYPQPSKSKYMYLLHLKFKNTNGFTLQNKLDIVTQLFFLRINYIRLSLVINTITVLWSGFKENKAETDVNLTTRELETIKDNVE